MEEEEPNFLQSYLVSRVRRFFLLFIALLVLAAVALVIVGLQSLTSIAAAFTLFALSIIFILGFVSVIRIFCCQACDGPVRRSFWFMTPSDASLVANSMPGSTRGSIVEIPYPLSTELPDWMTNHQLQQPPDYFSVTTYGHHENSRQGHCREETPPPSYKFLADSGLIAVADQQNRDTSSLHENPDQTPPVSLTADSMDLGDSQEQRTSVSIIMDENKPPKDDCSC